MDEIIKGRDRLDKIFEVELIDFMYQIEENVFSHFECGWNCRDSWNHDTQNLGSLEW